MTVTPLQRSLSGFCPPCMLHSQYRHQDSPLSQSRCYRWVLQAFLVQCCPGNVGLSIPSTSRSIEADATPLPGPNRTLGSHIPLDVYQETFEWLKPVADPDTNLAFYTATLARLALVCRYFAYYASYEMWRSLDLDNLNSGRTTEACCNGILTKLQPVEMLPVRIKECKLQHWVLLIYFIYCNHPNAFT
jgi:hypothetical protein